VNCIKYEQENIIDCGMANKLFHFGEHNI